MAVVNHEFSPVYQEDSAVLILGTIPSPKSREYGFYYSHPQNRFWKVMAYLFQEEMPASREDRLQFVLCHKIALWDVLARCEIAGAADSSIRNETPNDLSISLKGASIKQIYTTGKKADALYRKHCYPILQRESICLPSTSPANCACSFERLVKAYSQILTYCE